MPKKPVRINFLKNMALQGGLWDAGRVVDSTYIKIGVTMLQVAEGDVFLWGREGLKKRMAG